MSRDAHGSAVARFLMTLAAGGLLLAAGCTPQPTGPVREKAYGSLPRVAPRPVPTVPATPARIRPVELTLGRSVAGRPITGQIFGDGDDVVLIIASIHGNEQAGTPLVAKLAEYLTEHPEYVDGRRIIIVPVANPDGVAADRRHNLRGVDLNRNFPSSNYEPSNRYGPGPLSEPETRALYDLVHRYPPSRIVTLHQPLTCIDYDGPALELARAMAACCDLPVRKLGSKPGSLGSYAGLTRSVPVVTVEFARSMDRLSPAALWERYGRMLLAAIDPPVTYQLGGSYGRAAK